MSTVSPSKAKRGGVRARRGPGAVAAAGGVVSRSRITEVQRTRIVGAAARIVGEVGYSGMSVARITSRAGVSRRTFYEQFEDREDCFLALFEEALERASRVAREAADAAVADGVGERWHERVRAGLFALLALLEDDPAIGSLLIVDALAVGPKVLERRARALEALKRVIDGGRVEAKRTRGVPAPPPPPLTAEGVLGAVLSVIHSRLLERAPDPVKNGSARRQPSLTGLLNPLMGMIVLPYLGQEAAAQELERPKPKAARGPKTARAPKELAVDPLRGLPMRLTSRTLLVLSAISERPGASNRQIADVAGIHDQGQISKLLGRLERIGLIANYGAGQARGEANAWGLTPKGKEVEAALSPAPSR
jgi:AcrR family transcriptional regulator/DNA-binding MarR family transcriptional regulator